MRTPQFIQLHHDDEAGRRAELERGLRDQPAHVAPKFLYDALGSRLFDALTELPEYYPTRTERQVVERNLAAIAETIGTGMTLVDLGAGNGEKAERLFDALQPSAYVPVDISVDYLKNAVQGLQRRHPELPMVGIGMDFSTQLRLPDEIGNGARLMFYPGSSIGNFSPAEALAFLRQVRAESRAVVGDGSHRARPGGGLLIGVDLIKPKPILDAAYDDPLQVTAAFNRNLLRRLNALLGADARVQDWRHVAFFDETTSRIEMHLESIVDVTLRWPGGSRAFKAGDRIHTENSYKYTVSSFATLLRDAGFAQVQHWTDGAQWFAVFHAVA